MDVAMRAGSVSRRSPGRYRPRRQCGAVAIMFIVSVLVILGFMGLALDLAMLYNRRVEMQNAANTAALAAATELNGTQAGVNLALQRAAERFFTLPGTVVGGMSYQYSTRTMVWSNEAIEFAATPGGPWVDAGTARLQPNNMLYVRVNTQGLDDAYGLVPTFFMRILNPERDFVSTSGRAIAGRSAIRVTPLGICAMRPEAGRRHGNELEEFGFRRGVAYDLMQLNPNGTASGLSYLINPLVPPGASGAAALPTADAARPFVCTGTMAMARVTGGQVVVDSPFPLNQLSGQLNSRFDTYEAPCRAETAPPDANIQPYTYNDGSVPWMDTAPSGQGAALSLGDGKRWTVAGPDPTPGATTGVMYGPLWSYAKAARWSSYTEGSPEPAHGYTTFGSNDWSTLYSTGKPKPKSYPTNSTPYAATNGANFKKPGHTGLRGRRVLNVALLSCPVDGNKATVLGVGRFFMTVPAGADTLFGEFAGIAPEQTLGSQVRLFP